MPLLLSEVELNEALDAGPAEPDFFETMNAAVWNHLLREERLRHQLQPWQLGEEA